MGAIQMSAIQRWDYITNGEGGGPWVTYADHIAYLTDAENALRAEIQQRVDAAVVAARAEDKATLNRAENAWREEIRTRLTEQYEAGVKAARDAVAALPKHNMNVGSYIAAPPLLVINRKQALAAIDAINEGKYLI